MRDENGLRQAAANRQQALKILSVPFQPTILSLDVPFLIWEYPHPQSDVLIDTEYAPFNSFVRVLLDRNFGGDTRHFVFHFLWTNPSQFDVVVNVNTSLNVNGWASAQADDTLIIDYLNTLYVFADLQIYRWNGWGTDPVTGVSLNQTLFPSGIPSTYLARLSQESTSTIWGDGTARQEKYFNFDQVDLNYNLLVVPGLATTIFEISLSLFYSIEGDAQDPSQGVVADFATEELARRIICRSVDLEFLTPIPRRQDDLRPAAASTLAASSP